MEPIIAFYNPQENRDISLVPTKRDFVLIRKDEIFRWMEFLFTLSLKAKVNIVVSSGETDNGVNWMAWETRENHERRLGGMMLEEGR